MSSDNLVILKAHGSSNDVVIIEGRPHDLTQGDPTEIIRTLCSRAGPIGADGVYFVDRGQSPAFVEYFNADGSFAEVCGNGLRCVGRMILDSSAAESVEVQMRKGLRSELKREPRSNGITNVSVQLPPVSLQPPAAPTFGLDRLVNEPINALHPAIRFTALSMPNPHLIAILQPEQYEQNELIRIGRLAARDGVLSEGANVSFLIPIQGGDWFLRTYERGVGLTPSCGSATAAARVALYLVRSVDPNARVVIRSIGGPSSAWIEIEDSGALRPHLTGNATFVFTAEIAISTLRMPQFPAAYLLDARIEEMAAYETLYQENIQIIRASGIDLDGGA